LFVVALHYLDGFMPGLPFQSKLEPHYDFIVASRKKRMTWQQIADAIRAKEGPEFTCTRQAVQDFYKRKKRRPYAMGMEPDEPNQTAPSVAAGPAKPSRDEPPAEPESTSRPPIGHHMTQPKNTPKKTWATRTYDE
jgi:hypothetical protein